MPPQQTNITSDGEGDAVRLRLDVSASIRRYWRGFRQWVRRQNADVGLQDLNDRQLTDIGLTRREVDYLRPERAIDRLRDASMESWGRGV